MENLDKAYFWSFMMITTILHKGVKIVCGNPLLSNPEESGPFYEGDIRTRATPYSGLVNPARRWEDNIIPFVFERGYPLDMQETFLLATAHISDRTCLKFKTRSVQEPEKDYIFVSRLTSSSCFSYVGRTGGRQLLSLPSPCHTLGTFVHELLHAAGFHHEQSRTDRDSFIEIIWGNVKAGKESNFKKYDEATVTSFDVPYDYNSVLHYSSWAFSRGTGLRTILTLDETALGRIGQRKGMSELDSEKVNRMYSCNEHLNGH